MTNSSKRPIEILTKAEIERLLKACGPKRLGARDRVIIALMWRCGLRTCEVLAVKPRHIDLDNGVLRTKGKHGKSRTVGIDALTHTYLEAWLQWREKTGIPDASPLICTLYGNAMQSTHIRRKLRILAKNAGIERRVHPHGLRHCFTVEMSRAGIEPRIIQAALGHSNISTTNTYIAHLEPLEVVNAMKRRKS